jgi:hypothetical protein
MLEVEESTQNSPAASVSEKKKPTRWVPCEEIDRVGLLFDQPPGSVQVACPLVIRLHFYTKHTADGRPMQTKKKKEVYIIHFTPILNNLGC